MPVFVYEALDARGARVNGSVTADTPSSARQGLRGQGLRILDVKSATFPKAKRARATRRKRDQTADFARQMALLVRAGIPLVEALDVLSRQESGRLRTVIQDMRDRLAGGAALSEAMATHPDWFDALFQSAARVGQLSGRMDHALADMAEYLKERETLRGRIFNALAYPGILFVLGIGVVLFLMSYVVPQLLTVLDAAGRSLPLPTRMLKGMSDFLVGYWPVLVLFAVLLGAAFASLRRWRPGRRWLDAAQLRLPLLGPLLRKTLVAQFAQTMALLLHNGVPFLEALRLARESCRHVVLGEELDRMHQAVQRGSDIAPTLTDSQVFPPLVVHVVNVGQKAGELTEMLARLKEGYETEVRLAIARFAAVLEPALIVVMSVLVGFVVMATMLPILETTRAIR
jgi:type II secretory pathway component PulF